MCFLFLLFVNNPAAACFETKILIFNMFLRLAEIGQDEQQDEIHSCPHNIWPMCVIKKERGDLKTETAANKKKMCSLKIKMHNSHETIYKLQILNENSSSSLF